ncbi:ADA2C-like protein [Mya arenaria]|uniref:ADA2C-like protein n=1 Tax=Mya arenaria TaxID=6604 RepID=A0ABY7E4J9_MYAAR|nr:ADA2C-like protein [Mya arenaria]
MTGVANNTTYFEDTIAVNFGNIDTEFVPPDFQVTAKKIILAVVLTLMDLLTIFGNLLVLLSFAIERRLLQPFNLYILNLAVTDFFVAITAMTFYTLDTLLGYWPFGRIMCGVWIYFDFAMTFASVFTLVAISVDRFWCVTWPIHYKKYNNQSFYRLFVVAIWTPPFIADRLQHNEDHFCIWEPSDNREFVIFVALIGHYIPCLMMMFSYMRVLYVMRSQALKVAANTDTSLQNPSSVSTVRTCVATTATLQNVNDCLTLNDNTQTQYLSVGRNNVDSASTSQSKICPKGKTTNTLKTYKSRRNPITKERGGNVRERRIFITLTYVLSSYLICWFPFYIVFDTYAWAPELIPGDLYTFFFWMTYLNSTLNPFIYAYTSKEFRQAFMKVLRYVYRCRP